MERGLMLVTVIAQVCSIFFCLHDSHRSFLQHRKVKFKNFFVLLFQVSSSTSRTLNKMVIKQKEGHSETISKVVNQICKLKILQFRRSRKKQSLVKTRDIVTNRRFTFRPKKYFLFSTLNLEQNIINFFMMPPPWDRS